VIADLDICHPAKFLIDRRGDGAAYMPAGWADLLLKEGDTLGLAIWRWIAVEELQRGRGPGEG